MTPDRPLVHVVTERVEREIREAGWDAATGSAMRLRNLAARLVALIRVYGDLATSHLARAIALALGSSRRRVSLAVGSVAATALGLAVGRYAVAAVCAAPGMLLIGSLAWRRLGERWRLAKIARQPRDLGGLTPAEQTLAEMGLQPEVIRRVQQQAASVKELLIAEFDQNNRVVSEIGSIPLYAKALITREEFRRRSRNRMQIVVTSGLVAIRKQYSIPGRFINEVLCLDALQEIQGVPKIVRVLPRDRVMYQSFIAGRNLGSLLAKRGASVSIQFRAGSSYPGNGNWSSSEEPTGERALLLRGLSEAAGERFIPALGRLILSIHAAGVALMDIKHGNVLIRDGTPYLCDFDLARRFSRNSVRFMLVRVQERDRFNYLFGGDLLTDRDFFGKLGPDLSPRNHERFPSIYFGKGYHLRGAGSFARDSTRWPVLQRYFPDVRGRRILDLGGSAGVMPLKLLRAGAERVLAFEPDPQIKSFAHRVCRFAEIVDNRLYDLELVPESYTSVVSDYPSGYSLAVVTGGVPWDQKSLRRVFLFLGARVDALVVDLGGGLERSLSTLGGKKPEVVQALLTESGFDQQRAINRGVREGALIVASSTLAASTRSLGGPHHLGSLGL